MNASKKILVDTFKAGNITEDQYSVLACLYQALTMNSLMDHLTDEIPADESLPDPSLPALTAQFATITTHLSTGKCTAEDMTFLSSATWTGFLDKIVEHFGTKTQFMVYYAPVKFSMLVSSKSTGTVTPNDITLKKCAYLNYLFALAATLPIMASE